MSASDCFYLDSRIEHQFVNDENDPAMLLTVFLIIEGSKKPLPDAVKYPEGLS